MRDIAAGNVGMLTGMRPAAISVCHWPLLRNGTVVKRVLPDDQQSLVEIYRSFRAANPPVDAEPGPADPVAALHRTEDSLQGHTTKEEVISHG